MVLIPLILNYGINTNAMEIARFALDFQSLKMRKDHRTTGKSYSNILLSPSQFAQV